MSERDTRRGVEGPVVTTGNESTVTVPGDLPRVPGRVAEPDVHVPNPGGDPGMPVRIPDPEVPAPSEPARREPDEGR
jgi:hypothetical protein